MQIEQNDFYPIYGMWHKPWWQTAAFYYTCLTIIVFLLIAVIFYLVYHLRKNKPAKTPSQQALDQLYNLQKQLRSGHQINAEAYYVAITKILKNYFHYYHNTFIVSKTDEEFIRYLETTAIDRLLVDQLREIMQIASQAKFAQVTALPGELERALIICIECIQKTIPTKNKQREAE